MNSFSALTASSASGRPSLAFFLLPVCVLLWQAARSRRYFHMLQLNSYRNERYVGWLKKNPDSKRALLGIAAGCIVLTALPGGPLAAAAVCLLFLAAAFVVLRTKRQEKKPFVVTDRVKRQFFAAGLLLILLLAAALLGFYISPVAGLALTALLAVLPLPVRLPPSANRLMAGKERRIADSFIRSAAQKLRSQTEMTVVGVTGSYGKTSVKYILTELLSEKFNTLMTPESYNTPMGVVRTVNERLRPQHQVFVCEMGARQVGDVREICDIVKPTYGVITSVGIAHLETFKTTENIRKTKFELADALPEQGLAFLNFDSAPIASSGYSRPHLSYGLTPGLDCYSDEISVDERGTSFTLHYRDLPPLRLSTRLLGRHNVLNITGAAAVALTMGVPPTGIVVALRRLKPVPHRLELKGGGPALVIDDAYNANPEGAAEAVRVLGGFTDRLRILVTPGMVELGESEYAANREFGEAAASCCDEVVAVGRVKDALLEGLQRGGFDPAHFHAVKNLREALALLPSLQTRPSVILLENDLTDDLES
ncbi:MAG: UDP-N-acetylmuramoyl-tripeptide--D-alanyl-D-alanine ligase [Clostridia bacterium]|nr:UDP-N-acetylmuramoyl-tripeptide--D-alanyl-D-alanine ligase [Clostridia bacterium]